MNFDRKNAILDSKLHTQESQLLEIFAKDEAVVIFDIGACEGESSVRYSRIFEKSQIYTFEPIPKNYRIIESNIAEFEKSSQIHPFPVCLSNAVGEADFHISSGTPEEFKEKNVDWEFGNKSSSLLPPDKTLQTYDWIEFKEKITVPTIRLDGFMKEHSINQIDFVHLDVQGAELMVLDGAGDLFGAIKNIWLEVEAVALYKGQPIKKDIEAYFQSRGYIKLIDTVNKVDGDQFWSKEEWITSRKGAAWVNERKAEIRRQEKEREVPFFQQLRDKVQLRTRLKKMFS
jgi:FkbM family methyltransferase